jgi:hypothetical protein
MRKLDRTGDPPFWEDERRDSLKRQGYKHLCMVPIGGHCSTVRGQKLVVLEHEPKPDGRNGPPNVIVNLLSGPEESRGRYVCQPSTLVEVRSP